VYIYDTPKTTKTGDGAYRNILVCPFAVLNRWTDTDETLHSCSLQPEDCMKEDNPYPKYFNRDNK